MRRAASRGERGDLGEELLVELTDSEEVREGDRGDARPLEPIRAAEESEERDPRLGKPGRDRSSIPRRTALKTELSLLISVAATLETRLIDYSPRLRSESEDGDDSPVPDSSADRVMTSGSKLMVLAMDTFLA